MCRSAAAAASPGSEQEAEEEEGGNSWESTITCAPAFVTVDQSNPHYSAFSIDVSLGWGWWWC